jgi:PPM family protein phosphatase
MTGPEQGDGGDRPGVPAFVSRLAFPPPSTTVEATFGAQSRRGRARAVNEDNYLIFRLGRHHETLMTSIADEAIAARFDEYGYAMVVADGMGDTGAGEAASHLAVATLVYLVRYFGKWNLRVDDVIAREIMARAERFYRHIDGEVAEQRRASATLNQQTTLTATFGAGRDLFFAHVGHSRAYLCRRGRLMQLTRDQTLGQQRSAPLAIAPLIDVNLSARDLKHILTDAIGMRGTAGPRIDLERMQLEDDDRVLVCTNGLTDSVDEEAIALVLASPQSPDDQCQALVGLAQASGAEDDVTALVARYRIPG